MSARSATRQRPYNGALPRERRKLRHDKLIAAGYERFGTHGFKATKIEQICADAGVGIRSLYDEFASLEGLFLAVYDNIIQEAYSNLEQALSDRDRATPSVRLERGVRAYLHSMLDDPRSGRVVSIESSRLDSFLGGHRNKTLMKFARLIASIPASDEKRFHADIRTWSLLLAGGLNEQVVDAVLAKRKPDIAAMAQFTTEIYVRTLRAY